MIWTSKTTKLMRGAARLRPPRKFGLSIARREYVGAAPGSVIAEITPGEQGVRACIVAILDQQLALLRSIDDGHYTFQSPLLLASIGQHTRHSLDHLRKPLEAWRRDVASVVIRYDLRERNTSVEQDRHAAIDQIHSIRSNLEAVDEDALRTRVDAAFMLSGDGHEFAFDSTLSRELAFAVHHCIHHNALIKILVRHHFPTVEIADPSYGVAPSTINFNQTRPPTKM